MAFVSLAIIALVAFASPFIASAIPGKPVPETVFLLVFGAVLGPHMLDIIHVDAEVSLVSELGLAFLFLLAGFEIDPKSITGVEGRYGLATWVVTFGIAWLAVRFTPWFSVSHFDGIAVTLALTSTALGTLVPIMRERSLTGTRVGDSILAYGTWGELGPVLAMSVLLSARTGIQTHVILGLFAVDCVMLAGGSSPLPGLTEAVTQYSSFPCSLVNPFEGMEIGSDVRMTKMAREAPSYLTSCGLAMRRFLQ